MEDLAGFLSQDSFAVIIGGLVIVVLAIVFGRSAAAPAPESVRRGWRNPAAEWRTLCCRMEEAVRDHPTGRLVFKVVREYKPCGGEALIKWEFGGRSEFVLAVRFSPNQPDKAYRLAERRGNEGWKPLYLSQQEFGGFIDRLEEVINKYVSPLSRT